LLGRTVSEIFPKELARGYAEQDQKVLRTGLPIVDHLDMHWYTGRKPGWCLTTKLPVFGQTRTVIGIVGISRDLQAPGRSESVPPSLVKAMDYLESHYEDTLTPRILAQRAGLRQPRFARLIKRIFRLTPNQLIMQTRLAAAARLLIETPGGSREVRLGDYLSLAVFEQADRDAGGRRRVPGAAVRRSVDALQQQQDAHRDGGRCEGDQPPGVEVQAEERLTEVPMA
jgi:AraC-like DNA-binding protein